MSDEILTDEQIHTMVPRPGQLESSHIAANAEIARLREKINEQERFAVRREASHHADVARLRAELAEKERVLWDVPLYTLDERVVEPWKKRRAALASGGEQGQGEGTADKAMAGEMKGSLGDEDDACRTDRLTSAPDSSPDGKRVADQPSPASPVCGWTEVSIANGASNWTTGCGVGVQLYVQNADGFNACPYCRKPLDLVHIGGTGKPIVTDREEG